MVETCERLTICSPGYRNVFGVTNSDRQSVSIPMQTSSYAACSGKVQLLLVLLKKTMEHQWNTNKRRKTTEDNTGKTMNLLNHETRDIWSKIVPYRNTEE